MNGRVVLVAPLVRVVLHELVTQAEGHLLHAALGERLEDSQENRLNKNLGKDAGDQLDALLSSGHVDLASRGRVVQAVGVQAHAGARHAGAVFAHRLDVFQHRHGRSSGERDNLARHRVHIPRADHATGARVQQVVNVGKGRPVRIREHLRARIVGQVQVVQGLTQQLRVQALQVAHSLSHRLTGP